MAALALPFLLGGLIDITCYLIVIGGFVVFTHLRKPKQKIVYCLIISTFFLTGGCAMFKPPALTPETTKIDLSEESIVLLTVSASNAFNPKFQPETNLVSIKSLAQSGNQFAIDVDKTLYDEENVFDNFPISFQLRPGDYLISTINAFTSNYGISGHFHIPIYSTFSVQPNEVLYLGHIDATVIKRTDKKALPAGPILPLINQAIIGATKGTFTVKITDSYKSDINFFTKRYPIIAGYPIRNATLPPWRKPTARDVQ